jgi:hypothetical protein
MEQKAFLCMLLTKYQILPQSDAQEPRNEHVDDSEFAGDSIPLTFAQPASMMLRMKKLV